jgi:hypothetical protein
MANPNNTLFSVTNLSSGDLDISTPDISQRKASQVRIAKGTTSSITEISHRMLVARAAGNVTISPTFTVNTQFTSPPIDGTTGSTYVGQGNKIYNVTTYAIAQQNDSVLAQNLIQAQTDIVSLRILVNSLFTKVYGAPPVGA